MHDFGKVILAHAYPGLFPSVVEELQRLDWRSPMSVVEADFTGGSDHTVVGGTLATEWDLGPSTSTCILQHHSVQSTSPLTRLIGAADFIAGALYPFPAEARYPHVKFLDELSRARDEGGVAASLTGRAAVWRPAPM